MTSLQTVPVPLLHPVPIRHLSTPTPAFKSHSLTLALPLSSLDHGPQSPKKPVLPSRVPRALPKQFHVSSPEREGSEPESSVEGGYQTPSPYMHRSPNSWPGPGSRIAALFPPEFQGTSLRREERALGLDLGLGLQQDTRHVKDDHFASSWYQDNIQPEEEPKRKNDFDDHWAFQNTTKRGLYDDGQLQTVSGFWQGFNDRPKSEHGHVPAGIDNKVLLSDGDTALGKDLKGRKHACPVCDKRFNRPSSLQTHMSVHTGAKPYICVVPDCGRRFSVSSNLRRHEKTHNLYPAKSNSPPTYTHGFAPTHSRHLSHGSHASITSMGSGYMPTHALPDPHIPHRQPYSLFGTPPFPSQPLAFSTHHPQQVHQYQPPAPPNPFASQSYNSHAYPLPLPVGAQQSWAGYPMALPAVPNLARNSGHFENSLYVSTTMNQEGASEPHKNGGYAIPVIAATEATSRSYASLLTTPALSLPTSSNPGSFLNLTSGTGTGTGTGADWNFTFDLPMPIQTAIPPHSAASTGTGIGLESYQLVKSAPGVSGSDVKDAKGRGWIVGEDDKHMGSLSDVCMSPTVDFSSCIG